MNHPPGVCVVVVQVGVCVCREVVVEVVGVVVCVREATGRQGGGEVVEGWG